MTSVPLIPRTVLFGNPDRAMLRISPDGAHIAYLAPLNGVLNVWVAPRHEPTQARAITHDAGRGIRFFLWAYTSTDLLYIQDTNGDENWRLYRVPLAGGTATDLTPFEGVQAQLLNVSHCLPEEVVVGLNQRDPQWHDLYRVNITTGDLTLLEQHDRFTAITTDDHYRLRLAFSMTPDGGMEIFRHGESGWEAWDSIPPDDMLTTNLIGFDASGETAFLLDSRGRNTSGLFAYDLATRTATLLAEDARADAQDVVVHPTTRQIQAVSFVYERKRWQLLDPAIAADLAYLQTVADGEIEITSRTLDDSIWTVVFEVDNRPMRFYVYDRTQRSATFVFSNRSDLEQYQLAQMHPVVIPARDGLPLVSYYTLPPGSDSNGDGRPDQPLPMVLMPHGGPWGRDSWGFNAWHQWMANRGYAVLCVNFRASTGFGKAFVNAGNLEWGGKIMEDQVDAVQWAIAQGLADPQRIAVLGGSFGGYSVLAGLTLYPELYACGVDIVGPSNLITLLESMPPYWRPMLELFTTRVGDHRTEAGRALLARHSPLTYADRICKPLLIAQGANDPRVKQAESDQIVNAMQANNIPVTYVLYPDEGHGFARPENNLSFTAIAEAFLAACIGGRCEPIGSAFADASLQVLRGADQVPGLQDALAD